MILLILNLESCAKVKIKDHEFCADAGELGASCFYTRSNQTRRIPLHEWEEQRIGMICSHANTFADWKATILKLCRLAGRRCTYQAWREVVEFHDKIESFTIDLNAYQNGEKSSLTELY